MNCELSDDVIERDLEFAISIAHETGQRVLALRESQRWEGKMMADIGDQAADGLLQGFIRGRYPDDGLLSEETVDSPDRLDKRRTWIVDPLDGTKEFSQGRHDWAVHVALTVGGECALGAVALPSLEEILWGVCLPGRLRGGVRGGGEVIGGDTEPVGTPKVVVSRSHTPPWVEKFAAEVGAELLPCGSAGFKVSRLLQGKADVYVHKIGLKEWDTCAPETVARALGWHVCKLHGEEHRYNQANPKNHELVVCRPAWRERVLKAIADSGALED
ncbi:MAG: 3'(2'),5'-bisphosphate nucleotidase CysQ [Planctomycetes bacterium]|jgi:3'(2'), 5'-bisphosphate nucleotidase|nr:3'(2'),5'-bisphosphate nucleotidase CysQ [Planctomycetota bacterium]